MTYLPDRNGSLDIRNMGKVSQKDRGTTALTVKVWNLRAEPSRRSGVGWRYHRHSSYRSVQGDLVGRANDVVEAHRRA
jgi:hypothetical protein